MTNLVVRMLEGKLRLVQVGPKVISEGVVKLERIQVICPACGQQGEAVATDGRVKGYCAVTKQHVDFLIETQLEGKEWMHSPEYRTKHSAIAKKLWQDPEFRAKQVAAHTGKHHTAEHRAKISAALKRHNKNRGEGTL